MEAKTTALNFSKNQKTVRNLGIALFVNSIIALTFMLLWTYYLRDPSKYPEIGGRDNKIEYMVNFLYFTGIANFIILIASALRVFYFREKDILSLHGQRFKTVAFILMTVMGSSYGFLLSGNAIGYVPGSVVQNVLTHFINPILAIVVYILDRKLNPTSTKISRWQIYLPVIIFVILGIVTAVGFYYANDAAKDYAIYSFLRFEQQSAIKSVGYIVGIFGLFVIVCSCYIETPTVIKIIRKITFRKSNAKNI